MSEVICAGDQRIMETSIVETRVIAFMGVFAMLSFLRRFSAGWRGRMARYRDGLGRFKWMGRRYRVGRARRKTPGIAQCEHDRDCNQNVFCARTHVSFRC